MIVTRGLTKRYGRALVVNGVDLDVREGDRYGFIGPNGSGKTTTVRMMLGLVNATRGEIELLGHAVPQHVGAALGEVGALVEAPAAYRHLSARRNLDLLDAAGPRAHRMSRSARRERIEEVLDLVGLGGVGRRPVKAYSLGMVQRLGIAAALLGRPRLLVLDEPTNGLDPHGIQEIRELLLRLNREGTTVFLSSHLLAEVEQLCTRVGVMDAGRLVTQVTMDDVRRPTGLALVTVDDGVAALAVLDGRVQRRDGHQLVVDAPVPEVTRRLVAAGVQVLSAQPQTRSLEDLVLEVTGASPDRVQRDDPADGMSS